MKKIISILIAAGVIATAGSVVALASEPTETQTKSAGITQTNNETTAEKTTEEVTENAEAATEIVETSADSDKTTNSDVTESAESSVNTDSETNTQAESITVPDTENGEALEDDSETVTTDYDYAPNPDTGDNEKVLPAIAALLVSGVALAYCVVKGRKKKNKKDGE